MNTQQGSVLIVSLIMLLLLSLVGLSGIQTTALEERMAGNYQDKGRAFQAAEAALVEAEEWVLNSANFDASVHMKEACSGDSLCFDEYCANGLCLTGAITSGCELRENEHEPWREKEEGAYLTDDNNNDGSGTLINVWETSGKHKTVTTTLNGVTTKAKYIVEFRCFTEKDLTDGVTPDAYPNDAEQWAEMYRVTVLATGGSDNTKVMLQSVIKKD